MKALYASALSLFTIATAAQPVLDFSNTGTVVGDQFTYNAGPWLDPGAAGANETWDLSALTSDSLIFIEFIDPTTTPEGASFPNATIATEDDSIYAYNEFNVSGGSFLGLTIPGEAPAVYSDPQVQASYPATYMTAWTDPFHAEFSVAGFAVVRDGTISADADGYGTLILPWGTLTDVLRVTHVQDFSDVTSLITIDYHNEFTYFLQAGTHYPIVHLFSNSTTVFGNTTVITGAQWLVAGSVGSSELATAPGILNVYPDPASDVINIEVSLAGGPAILEAVDATGRIVHRHSLSIPAQGSRTETLNVEQLDPGAYLLRVIERDRSTVRKFTVQ